MIPDHQKNRCHVFTDRTVVRTAAGKRKDRSSIRPCLDRHLLDAGTLYSRMVPDAAARVLGPGGQTVRVQGQDEARIGVLRCPS